MNAGDDAAVVPVIGTAAEMVQIIRFTTTTNNKNNSSSSREPQAIRSGSSSSLGEEEEESGGGEGGSSRTLRTNRIIMTAGSGGGTGAMIVAAPTEITALHHHQRRHHRHHPQELTRLGVRERFCNDDDQVDEDANDDDVLVLLNQQPTQQQQQVEEALDEYMDNVIGGRNYGPFQLRIMIAAGLCFAADAMEILLLSFLVPVLKIEWQLTDTQFSWIFGSIFVGAFVGTLTLGRLADLVGRKPIFILTASLIAMGGIATACIPHGAYNQLLACRFVVGFGIGGITIPFDTLAEFTTTTNRATKLVMTSYFWTTSTLLVPIMAWITLDNSENNNSNGGNWRIFVLLCALPCVISTIVGLWAIPESPRWLLQKGETTKAIQILQQAARINNSFSDDLSSISNHYENQILNAVAQAQAQASQQQPKNNAASSVWDLFSPRWYKTTILLWCLWGSYAFLYYGTVIAVTLAFFTTSTQQQQQQQNDGGSSSSYQFDYIPIILSSSAEVAGVTLVLWTVDKFGRINCLTAYFFLGGLSVLGLCFLQQQQQQQQSTEQHTQILKIGLAFVSRFFVYSGSNIVWIVTAELLETSIRTTGHSAANAIARVGAFLAPFIVRPDSDSASAADGHTMTIGITMFCVSLFCVVCAKQLPETVGRPLGIGGSHAGTTTTTTTTGDNDPNTTTSTRGGRMMMMMTPTRTTYNRMHPPPNNQSPPSAAVEYALT